jgi:DNA-binding YbaB/EbfC family protein
MQKSCQNYIFDELFFYYFCQNKKYYIMFGKMFDIMGKIEEAKKNVEATKKRLDNVLIDAESAQGKIKVTVTGNRALKAINIDDDLMQDKEMLEDYLMIALNKALEEAGKMQEEELKRAAKDAMPNIPGLDGLI